MLIMEIIKIRNGEPITIYPPSYVHKSVIIGTGTKIGGFADISRDVEIGRGCNIQCHVNIPNGVKIGNGVFIGPGVRMFNDKYMNGLLQPPVIGDFCRIGGATKILPGVVIGRNAFIGADCIITKDVPEGTVVLKGKW